MFRNPKLKKPETTELGYMEVCTTQWTSQWTILQNNTGRKKNQNPKNKPQNPPPDTKLSFIFPQGVIFLQDLISMPQNYLVVRFIAWKSIFRTE